MISPHSAKRAGGMSPTMRAWRARRGLVVVVGPERPARLALLARHVAQVLGREPPQPLVEPGAERDALGDARAGQPIGQRGELALQPLRPGVVRLEVGMELRRDPRQLRHDHPVLVLRVLVEEPDQPADRPGRAGRLLRSLEIGAPRERGRLGQRRPDALVNRSVQIDSRHRGLLL